MVGEYESSVDRQIREAQERGEFDNLPGAGKPLEFLGEPQDDNWWVKGLIERERLDMTAALPPQLALRKERQALPEQILRERTEDAARYLVEDFNARVRELWTRPVEGPLVAVRTADVEEMLAHWRTSRATPSAPVSAPAPLGQPRAWPRLRGALMRLRHRS